MKVLPGIFKERPVAPFFLFLLLAALVHWPVTFFSFSLQHDVINVLLPWRFFGSEALQEGIFPLWNPYQQCGYPFYADLQYPIWYPEFFFLGSFIRYSPLTLHLLFILYTALAGWGMFKLASTIGISRSFSLLAGSCFMFSGLITGHAQSLVTVLGMTWLPWVLNYFMRTLHDPFQLRTWLLLMLSTFLMLTGGYQAISFMLFYILLILLLFHSFLAIRQGAYKWLRWLILGNASVLAGLVILCAGMFLSLFQVFPYLDRLDGLSLEASQRFIFHPADLISMLLPHSSIKDVHESTGISLTNLFFGTMLLGGSVFAFTKRLPSFLYIISGISLIYLLASFGPYTAVQSFFYHYVPLMDQFKYPVFYRSFFVVAAILLGTWYLDREKPASLKRFCWYAGIAFLLFYTGSALWAYSGLDTGHFSYFDSEMTWIESIRESSLLESILFQSAIQSALYGSFLIFILRFRSHLSLRRTIMGFVFVELLLATSLNAPSTVYGPIDPMEMDAVVERYPHGFPASDLSPLEANADSAYKLPNLWKNLGNYSDRPSYSAMSSFHLAHQERLKREAPSLRDRIFQNPVAYLSPELRMHDSLEKKQGQIEGKELFVREKIYKAYQKTGLAADEDDTLICTKFSPNEFRFELHTENPQFLALLQNSFPGWKVHVNGQQEKLLKVNEAFMAVPLEAGNHTVRFTFSRPWVETLFYISMAGFFALVLTCLLLSFPAQKKYILGGMLLFILAFTLKRWKVHADEDPTKELHPRIKRIERKNKGNTLFHYVHSDRPAQVLKDLPDRLEEEKVFASVDRDRLSSIARELKQKQPKKLSYSRFGVNESPELLGTLAYFFDSAEFQAHKSELSYASFGIGKGGSIEKWPMEKKGSPGWISVDPINSSSPKHSDPIHHVPSSKTFGSTFEIHGDEIPKGNERILSCGGWFRCENEQKAFLNYDLKRNIYTDRHRVLPLKRSNEGPEAWSYFQFATYLPVRMDQDTRIRVYLWNPNGTAFEHKGLTVRVISPGHSN